MFGKNAISINWRDFIRGMASSPEINDGGFSPESSRLNLISERGKLNIEGMETSKSTGLEDAIIASCEDPTYTGKDRVFLDDTGNFYSYNGTALTKEDTASGDLFTRGTTDFVAWYNTTDGLQFYATTKAGANGDIVQWNKTSTLVENWWSAAGELNQGALSALTAWRPLLVFETYLYIGDKNNLHRVRSDGTTVDNSILSLDYNKTISALGIDPSSGMMLIGMTTGVDYSASRNGKSFIGVYDGYSNKLRKIVEVNGLITAFKTVDGNVFVFYGNKIGIWTGSSIKFLREMDFDIGTANYLVYPHRVESIDNTLYFCGNLDEIWAYGEIVSSQGKVFYKVVDVNGDTLASIMNVGGNNLGFSYLHSTSKYFSILNVTSSSGVTSGASYFYSRRYSFDRPIMIRGIRMFFGSTITTGSAEIGQVSIIDDGGTTTLIKTITQDASVTQKVVDTEDIGIKTSIFQLKYLMEHSLSGVEKILIYYDVAE
jgi:hypothetical protein